MLDPELVLLGGRYGAPAAEQLADDIRVALAERLETDPAALPRVRPYPVGPDAALTGAASSLSPRHGAPPSPDSSRIRRSRQEQP